MIKFLAKTFMALVFGIAILIGGTWFALTQTDLGATVANAVLDQAAISEKIEGALLENESAIAQKLGVSTQEVDAMVRELDIGAWDAVSLPADASVAQRQSFDYGGTSVSATLYDDPAYVTVEAAGQSLTFHIPESAQRYRELLQ